MARRRLVDPQAAVDAVGRRALGVATQAEADATADELQRYRDTDEARFEAPVVSGSTADGTALQSVLAALIARGLVVDATDTVEDEVVTGTVTADIVNTADVTAKRLLMTVDNTVGVIVSGADALPMLVFLNVTGPPATKALQLQQGTHFGIWSGSDEGLPKFYVTGSNGNTTVAGDLKVNTDKFTVTAATGNTTVAGTLGVSDTLSATKATGTGLAVTSDVKVNTDKFVVTGASGDTTVAGTLGVTGAVTGTSRVIAKTDGYLLGYDGRSSTATAGVTVSNDLGPTNFANVYAVPGGEVTGSTHFDIMKVEAWGTYARTLSPTVKIRLLLYNASTGASNALFDSGALTVTADGEWYLTHTGQIGQGTTNQSAYRGATTLHIGPNTAAPQTRMAVWDAALASNWTTDKEFRIEITWSAASTSNTITMQRLIGGHT